MLPLAAPQLVGVAAGVTVRPIDPFTVATDVPVQPEEVWVTVTV